VSDRKKSIPPEVGFPPLSWEEEEQKTRPMPLHERPLQARIDVAMALVARYHVRIALAIEGFWGHRDCAAYLQTLVLDGYKEGEKRMGFRPEVLGALMTLLELHKQQFGY